MMNFQLSTQIGAFGSLVFCPAVTLLLLTHHCEGQSQVIGPLHRVAATVGDDIILPCHLKPAMDAAAITFEWTRPDLDPRFVHVWRVGEILLDLQNPSYEGRTSVSVEKLKSGDISLKLSDVKPSDEGKYRCFIPEWEKDSFVELVVGAVSASITVGIDRVSKGLVLQCESKGWYPEPEMSWLDGEGHVLSAGPTETVRGPDGLYTVSSRVTVEKRHRNNFTCRVQQKNTNQTRETQIHVPDDFFEVGSSSAAVISLTVSLTVCILLIPAAVFVLWKRRQKRIKTKLSHEEEKKNKSTSDDPEHQSLMEGGRHAETTAMNREKGGEKKTLSLSSNKESLAAVKNTEGISSKDLQKREKGQKVGQEENQSVQRRTNEKERNQTKSNLQTETSEKQDGGKRQRSEGKNIEQMKEKIENTSQETKTKTEDRKLTKEKEMLNEKRTELTTIEKCNTQRAQTESQRAQEERKRNTDLMTLTAAHGHIMRF